MNRALAFFRIFDVAFFVPGILLLACLAWTGWLPNAIPEVDGTENTADLISFTGLFVSVVGLAGVYALGLFLHGVSRIVKKSLKALVAWIKTRQDETGQDEAGQDEADSWYEELRTERLEDLTTYFWYLRATVWNLAVVVVFLGLLLAFGQSDASLSTAWTGVGLVVMAVVYLFLGWEYDSALDKAEAILRTRPDEPDSSSQHPGSGRPVNMGPQTD